MKCPNCGALMKKKEIVCRKCFTMLSEPAEIDTFNRDDIADNSYITPDGAELISGDSAAVDVDIHRQYGNKEVLDASGLPYNIVSSGLGVLGILAAALHFAPHIPNMIITSIISIAGIWIGCYGASKSRRGNSGYAYAVIGVATGVIALGIAVYY